MLTTGRPRLYWGAGAQDIVFQRGDAALHQAYLKFTNTAWLSFRSWEEARDNLLLAIPEGYGSPQFYALARREHPQQPFFDIEYYTDGEYPDARRVIARLCSRFTSWVEDHALIDHECDWRIYTSCGSRDTGKAFNPAEPKGTGFKNSFHVVLRCDHHFAMFEDLRMVMKSFCNAIRAEKPAALIVEGQLVFDLAVYTPHRAFRLVGSAKSEGGVPIRIYAYERDMDESNWLLHVHAYVEPTSVAFQIDPDLPDPDRHRAIAAGPHDRAPRPMVDRVVDHLADEITHIMGQLGRANLAYYHERLHVMNDVEQLLEFTFRLPVSPTARDYWKPYQRWFMISKVIARWHPNRERAEQLWLQWAVQIGKNNSSEAQWRSTCRSIDLGRTEVPPAFHFVRRFRDFLIPPEHLEAYEGLVADGGLVQCVCNDVWHEAARWDTRLDTRALPGILFHCRVCDQRRFFGYVGERAVVFSRRYMSEHDDLMQMLRTAVEGQASVNYVRPQRTIVLASQMGTGKTRVMECVGRVPAGARVCLLSMRILLAIALHGRYHEELPNLQLYFRHRGSLHSRDQIVIQLDSILRLLHDGRVVPYDIVVLDEPASLLAHLSAATLDKRRKIIIDAFEAIIRTARLVLVADADFGPREWEFLKALRPDTQLCIYRNIATPCRRNHVLFHSFEDWHAEMVDRLDQGENIYIVGNARLVIETAVQYIRDNVYPPLDEDDILVYTSNSDQATREGITDCVRLWCTKRVVAYTPVISSGVDFNPPEPHFHTCFLYDAPGSACPRDLHQQAGRVRQLLTDTVCVFIQPPRDLPANFAYGDIYQAQAEIETLHRSYDAALGPLLNRLQMIEDDEEGSRFALDIDHVTTRVLLHNLVEQKRGTFYPQMEYMMRAWLHGDTVEHRAAREIHTSVVQDELRSLSLDLHDSQMDELSQSQISVDSDDSAGSPPPPEADAVTLTRSKWMAFLNLTKPIEDPACWGMLLEPRFQERLLTFVVLTHPEGARTGAVFLRGLIDQRLIASNTVERYLNEQGLDQRTRVLASDAGLRAELVSGLLRALDAVHVGQPFIPPVMAINAVEAAAGYLRMNAERLKQAGFTQRDWTTPLVRKNFLSSVNHVLSAVNYVLYKPDHEPGVYYLSRIRQDQMLCAAQRVVDPVYYRELMRAGQHTQCWFPNEDAPPDWIPRAAPEKDLRLHREPISIAKKRSRLR